MQHLKKIPAQPRAVPGNRWLLPFHNSLLRPRLWHLSRHSAPAPYCRHVLPD